MGDSRGPTAAAGRRAGGTVPSRILAAAAAALLLASCGGTPTDEGTSPGTEGSSATAAASAEPGAPELPTSAGPTGEELPTDEPEVLAAILDLQSYLVVERAEITVVSYTAVTWPDGAIGCPEPGMDYTQAQVPGTLLLLSAHGTEYAYHADQSGDLRRCDNPRDPVSGSVN